MSQGESQDGQAINPIREAARRELARALERVALDPEGTGVALPSSAPPSPSAGAKRTVPAPPGAPGPAITHHSDAPADADMGRGGAPGGAVAGEGDADRAAQRAAFDRMLDRTYPGLARAARPVRRGAPERPVLAVNATPLPGLQPRQLTAARLLLAGWRVTAVAARLRIDRHTLSDWMKDPAFQREVRRMAVALPVDELVKGDQQP